MFTQLEKEARKILGVTADADEKEIRLAYWRLAKSCHPDHSGPGKSQIYLFNLISEAYEVLTNPKNNRRYTIGRGAACIWPDQPAADSAYRDWWLKQFGELF